LGVVLCLSACARRSKEFSTVVRSIIGRAMYTGIGDFPDVCHASVVARYLVSHLHAGRAHTTAMNAPLLACLALSTRDTGLQALGSVRAVLVRIQHSITLRLVRRPSARQARSDPGGGLRSSPRRRCAVRPLRPEIYSSHPQSESSGLPMMNCLGRGRGLRVGVPDLAD
jgi:hypothetical protein